MQAILIADYTFTPVEYWRGVSTKARQFIKRCLTVDPKERMTAHEALTHPWIAPNATRGTATDGSGEDLLPVVKKNFNARRTLHAAIDTIRAINKLREGGAMMNGALSRNPPQANAAAPPVQGGQSSTAQDGDKMDIEGEPGEKFVGQGGDEMEIDSQGHGRGQTESMISAQEKKIGHHMAGLWQRR